MNNEQNLFDRGELAGNEKLIRYMSISKLMRLVTSQTIYLPRIDQFSDPLEGRFTVADLTYLRDAKSGVNLDKWEMHRCKAYASCWTSHQRESEAHWRSYADSEECAAVVTKAASLRAALQEWQPGWSEATYALGMVRYVNPDEKVASEQGPGGYRKSLLRFATLKDMSFRWEEEARAVVFPRNPEWAQNSWPLGLEMPIKLEALMEKIVLGPSSPSWLLDTVMAVVSKADLNVRVEKSELVAIHEAHRV